MLLLFMKNTRLYTLYGLDIKGMVARNIYDLSERFYSYVCSDTFLLSARKNLLAFNLSCLCIFTLFFQLSKFKTVSRKITSYFYLFFFFLNDKAGVVLHTFNVAYTGFRFFSYRILCFCEIVKSFVKSVNNYNFVNLKLTLYSASFNPF